MLFILVDEEGEIRLEKLKKKLKTWDTGKKFMQEVSILTKIEIKEIEEYLKCENDEITISCHLSQKGDSFVLVKSINTDLILEIDHLLSKFV
ncbi:MAG: hypothetical protein HeimC2_06250 [Candidatus Heimdallarchaeota archaeon LC_2]|nr:MAG: hypothetical protein HeimC2_06250 [Candidatus Heimdallarchaeota archaeon LC_2]